MTWINPTHPAPGAPASMALRSGGAPVWRAMWRATRRAVWRLGCALLLAFPAFAQDAPQPRLPTATLTAGMHQIQAELAVTDQQQMMGMMFRREMGASEGMLFVNAAKGLRCFWMRNTYIPLSIAFLDDDGTIVNLADMQPLSETSHCSARPVRFALEMRQGWFDKRGIRPGMRITGGPIGAAGTAAPAR
jgi:uncharacterized membrane protein (UPF0127 family)